MRPDEHKKKNSSRYKKKHGIESASNNKRSSSRDTSLEAKASNDFSIQHKSSDVEEEQEKSYSRRQLASNWDRYDEPQETVEQIGADFNVLISAAGGADSHMMLESEKQWGNKQDLDEILTINFQKLANSLTTLPFCERLGLDENQFETSYLNLLNDGMPEDSDSSSSLKAFTLHKFEFQNPISNKGEKLAPAYEKTQYHNQTPVIEKSEEILPSAPQKLYKTEENLEKSDNTSSSIISSETDSIANSRSIDCASKDAEILSETSSAIKLPALHKDESTATSNVENLELELDSLLTGNISTSNFTSKKVMPNNTNSCVTASANAKDFQKANFADSNKEQDDLEDWLDSII